MRALDLTCSSLLLALVIGACCFGPPAEASDESLAYVARAYLRAHRDEVLLADASPPPSGDAGASGPRSRCATALAEALMSYTAVVMSRGHSGASTAADVQLPMHGCLLHVVVRLLRSTDGEWDPVGLVVLHRDGTVALTLGVVGPYAPDLAAAHTVGGPDFDLGSDETF